MCIHLSIEANIVHILLLPTGTIHKLHCLVQHCSHNTPLSPTLFIPRKPCSLALMDSSQVDIEYVGSGKQHVFGMIPNLFSCAIKVRRDVE